MQLQINTTEDSIDLHAYILWI